MGTCISHVTVQGNTILDIKPTQDILTRTKDTIVRLPGKYKDGLREVQSTLNLTDDILSRHSMFIGGTGSGKTNAMYHFVNSICSNLTSSDVMVIFDTKGDFYKRFHRPKDIVISNSKKHRNIRENWNIFKEILVDGWNEEDVANNAAEITMSFFKEAKKNTTQQFFPVAAQDLMCSILRALIRLGHGDDDFKNKNFTNKAFKNWIANPSYEKIADLLDVEGMEDLASGLVYLGNGEGEQGLGVLSEIQSVMGKILTGTFADEGYFSIRKFVREKGGKILFIEYDTSIGEVLTPMYRLLFDLALKEALSADNANGKVYMVCDEFKLLPNLEHIVDAVNFGRGMGLRVIAGVQSIEQLYETYGEYKGRNIVSGFSSVYAFKANDSITRKFASDLYGDNVIIEKYTNTFGKTEESKRNGKTVEDWDMLNLDLGEAIIGLPFKLPFRFTFDEYTKPPIHY